MSKGAVAEKRQNRIVTLRRVEGWEVGLRVKILHEVTFFQGPLKATSIGVHDMCIRFAGTETAQ